ncbi:MAG: phosphoribosylaminoimidazolesuccinocarboxamide synthase, partial [Candidatus Bathyarchaeia archaeon]
MPDHIRNKGASLCLISAYFFQKLDGICRTHYVGVLEGERVKTLEELEAPSNTMEVKLVRVLRPESRDGKYDYTVFGRESFNFLIPLEIVYRNSLPPGSSVFKRLQSGETTYKQLGLNSYPRPGERLDRPIIDVSTKLEKHDRDLTWDEAREIASLTEGEVEEINRLVLRIDSLITSEVSKAGLTNEDGKIELAFDQGRGLMVVDAVGTPDECRFTYDGVHVSKEIARVFYRGTSWFSEVEKAKNARGKMRERDWKSLVKTAPPALDPKLRDLISNLYMACANEITGRKWFDAPKLADLVGEYKMWRGGE